MKKSWIKKISLSLACLLGIGGLTGAVLSSNKEASQVEASTLYEELTLDQIIKKGTGTYLAVGNFGIFNVHAVTASSITVRPSSNPGAQFVYTVPSGITIGYVSLTATTTESTEWLFSGTGDVVVDNTTVNYSSAVNVSEGRYIVFQAGQNLPSTPNKTITSFSFKVYQGSGAPSTPVTIAKGTGIKSVYLSTSSTATSGSASGTNYNPGTTVYGFAELDKGYSAKSGWTLVSGTAGSEGAKYRVGSVSAGSNNFGTISADLSQYTISYELNGGTATNPTSYSVTSNTFALSNPTRTGYTFKGWSGTDLTGDENLTVTVSKGSIGNRSYTANWQVNTYNISYTLNGGALPSGKTNPSTYNVETATFTLNNPQREGYNFVGWTGSNGSTPQTTVTITKGSTGNKSYTANWTLVEELQAVVDAINDLGGPTNISYPGSKTSLENVELLYNSLSSDLKTVLDNDYKELVDELADDRGEYDSQRDDAIEDAISKIDAIGDTVSYPGSREVIFAARDALAGLDESDRVDTIVTNLNDYNDALDTYNALKDIAVDQVIEAINNIVTNDEGKAIYPNSKSSLENSESLYEDLAPEEKYPSSTVSNYNDLVTARSDYNASRDDALNEVTNAIDAISKPFDGDRKEQIANAQQLFDVLDSSDKNATSITILAKLDDAKAADAVADAIEALPTVADTDEYRALVSGVREQYEALSDDQEAFVPRTSDIHGLLVEKEEAIKVIDAINAIGDVSYPGSEALITAANLAYENYINLGYNPDYIVNYDVLDKDNDDFYNVDNVAKLIEAIPAPAEDQSYYDAVDAARTGNAALEDDEQQLLIEAIFDPITNMTYAEYLLNQGLARDVIEKIDNIDNVTYNAGVDDSLDDIVAAETAYNAIKDNEYVKGIVDSINHQTLVDDRTIYDHVDEVADLISALTPAADQSYYDAVDAAEAAYDNLTDKEQAIIDAATNIDYEKVLADHVAAKEVIEAIDEIGTLTYDGGINDSLSDIIDAEAAYDAIKDNADVKAIVDSVNHQTLVDDRESYEEVKHTVELIEAIGEIKNDEETKQDLEEAWEAYNALSQEEQALVQGYNNTYKTLDDDQHVYEALVLIDDIGTVSYDSESEEKIAKAREYYDSLTEDQKGQLGEEPLVTLVNSETQYASLKKNANILVVVLLIVACLTIAGGICFLFFLLKRKKDKNGDDNNKGKKRGKPVKAMSVGGFIPGITLISHYLDAPWLALYILAGVAVLLWISIFVVVIMKKKQVGPFKKKAEVAKAEPQVSMSSKDEEVETISDEKGNIFQIRYIKSFTAKLSQSEDVVKDYYTELKNYVLSFRDTHSRVSWHYDAINVGRGYVLKFSIRGKTLCVYLALNPSQVDEKYKIEAAKGKRFEDVPCLYRIKNGRRLGYAKELIDMLMRKLKVEQGEVPSEDYYIKKESTKALLEKGLIKEVKTKVSAFKVEELHSIDVSHADELMSDEKAESVIELDTVHHHREGKKEIINIDTLSQNYNDGDEVTLDSLIEKKLVPAKTGYVKVLARGVLDKKLTVDLDEYSLQAVKMIVLMGGHAKRIN